MHWEISEQAARELVAEVERQRQVEDKAGDASAPQRGG